MKIRIFIFFLLVFSTGNVFPQNMKITNKNELRLRNYKTNLQLSIIFNSSMKEKIIFKELLDNIVILSLKADGVQIHGEDISYFDIDYFDESTQMLTSEEEKTLDFFYSAENNAWKFIAYDNDDMKCFSIPITARRIQISYYLTYISKIEEISDCEEIISNENDSSEIIRFYGYNKYVLNKSCVYDEELFL